MQTTELDWAVGPYKVLERIGGGAAGVVYRARHAQSGQMAAVKTVRIADPLCLRSIRREIRALRTLEHPGIVGVLDEGVAEGLPWYAMPIVEGTTLRDDIDTTLRRRLDSAAGGELPRALNLARKLCESLAYIHDKGLVHKDLKPENVIVRPDGSPVIVDLGLASAFSGWRGRDALEASGRFEGSLGFMAPEQIDGGRVDARADLYSLGCILYEMIALRPVFSAEGWDLIREHQMTVPPAPSTVISGVSAALDDLVMRLLGKRPRDRIGYATDVAVALESIELGVEARSAAARSYLYQPEFAGRGELLKELERALDAAKLVGRQVAIIGGESGAGKTRMAIEIAGLANQAGFRVITGECRPLDCGTSRRDAMLAAPLDPFRPLLQALADESRTAGAAAAEALLGSDAGILSIYEPSLGERRSASALDDLAQLSPQEARHRVTAAVARAVVELSKRRPLFLALDDLQWADDLTVETLAVLIRGSRDSVSLMLVGTYRTEEPREALGPLLSAPGTMHRRLERLDENAVESIVSDMLALPSPPAQLVHYLATQSSGNPFFVAEYLRAAVSKGLLSSDYLGRWQVTARDLTPTQLQDALPLPSSLQELMQNWLAGLPPRSRRLAELASVYGREFEDELLASDDPAEDLSLLDEVEELRRRNVLEDGAAGRVRFTHDKLREIVYDFGGPFFVIHFPLFG
jgi:aminoglycoside phosphotransferase (APT) family kinase protein